MFVCARMYILLSRCQWIFMSTWIVRFVLKMIKKNMIISSNYLWFYVNNVWSKKYLIRSTFVGNKTVTAHQKRKRAQIAHWNRIKCQSFVPCHILHSTCHIIGSKKTNECAHAYSYGNSSSSNSKKNEVIISKLDIDFTL